MHQPPAHSHPAPWHHPACLDDAALLQQCQVGRGRSGGPGGQNRNKVETLIELLHQPTGIEAHAGERRSQIENSRVALRRLRLALAVNVRTAVPIGEVGSTLWRSRLAPPIGGARAARVVINPDHHEYPALLAEALDVIAAAAWDLKKAALRLDCSATQLIKLVREHPPAMVMLNRQRADRNLRELK